jgi:hypothetical protein
MQAFRCSGGIFVKCSKAAMATSCGDSPSSLAILLRSSRMSVGNENSLMESSVALMDSVLSLWSFLAKPALHFKRRAYSA